MEKDPDGKGLLSRGESLEPCDEQIVKLAEDFKANYVVLPRSSEEHMLDEAFASGGWVIYKPVMKVTSMAPPIRGLADQDRFLRQVAWPGIEKNRKADARVQVRQLPPAHPVEMLNYKITQVNSSFGFGCSLPFFSVP
jgi:hypothetical protein